MICRTCCRTLRLGPTCVVCQPDAPPEPPPIHESVVLVELLWPPTVLTWVRDTLGKADPDTLTDHECAIACIVRRGWVRENANEWAVGIANALYSTYIEARAATKQASVETEASLTGVYVGTEGTKCELRGLLCTGIITLPKHEKWGERFLLKFCTPEGGAVCWFTGVGLFDPTPGQTYDVQAFVKSHTVYEGERQTVVQRVRPLK